MNYQYLTRNQNTITYEDPSDPTSTLEQRRKLTKPIIDGVMVPFVRSEVIISRVKDPRAPESITSGADIQAINKLQLIASVGKTETSLAELRLQWNTMKKMIDSNFDILFTGRTLSDNTVIEINPVVV